MPDFLYLIHDDVEDKQADEDPNAWAEFIATLRKGGHFSGGSSLGEGCSRRGGSVGKTLTPGIAGYMLIHARDLAQATALLDTCPVIRRGGTVEVRALVRD